MPPASRRRAGILDRVDLGFLSVPIVWLDIQAMREETETSPGEDPPDGFWDGEGTIYLHRRRGMAGRYARGILLHEIIHMAVDEYHGRTAGKAAKRKRRKR